VRYVVVECNVEGQAEPKCVFKSFETLSSNPCGGGRVTYLHWMGQQTLRWSRMWYDYHRRHLELRGKHARILIFRRHVALRWKHDTILM